MNNYKMTLKTVFKYVKIIINHLLIHWLLELLVHIAMMLPAAL